MSEQFAKATRIPTRPTTPRSIKMPEKLTIAQLAGFIILASWYYGGAAPTAAFVLSLWGSVGIGLFAYGVSNRLRRKQSVRRILISVIPLLALNAIGLLSVMWRDMKTIAFGQETYLTVIHDLSIWLPACALPGDALRGLWLFDGIYLSSMALLVNVQQRSSLRMLINICAANLGLLAVFGTLQKLSGATGLYFGAVESPQVYFFGPFVYDNHWASFAVLMGAACGALTVRILKNTTWAEITRTAAPVGLIVLLLVSVAIPLSGSRAGTLMYIVLLGLLGYSWLQHVLAARRRSGESPVPVLGIAATAVLVAAAVIWFVAGESIASRFAKTHAQLSEMKAQNGIGGRAILYQDTLRMAKERPVFGWGINSYPRVFDYFSTTESKADRLPVHFHDAHSDWLQAFAERGLVGFVLLGLCAIVPFLSASPFSGLTTVPLFILAGCGLILAYALVEFPFGNPAVLLAWWASYFTATRYADLGTSQRVG